VESSLESTNNKLLGREASEPEATKGFSAYSLKLLYLFLAALALRLWFNFATDHVNSAIASDASEYIRYATALSKLNWLAPQFGPEWKEFIITGPSFPFFLWLCSLTATNVVSADITVFLVAQSVLSSLTVVLIALIGKNLWDNKTGMIAGYLAAFYPAFIVNSGRLYSETFATFIEIAAVLIITQIAKEGPNRVVHRWHWLKYVLLGALLIVLQLTRSSMILLTGATLLFVFISGARGARLNLINWRKGSANVAMVLFGCATVLAPWLLFEKTAFNKLSLVVDRVGHYNLFIGTDTEIQGFLSYPYPDGRGIEQKSFLQLVKESYKKSPSRFVKLMLDKPARLYKFPWNDFRTAIGPVAMPAQVAFHQFILLLAIIGLAIAVPFVAKNQNEEQDEVHDKNEDDNCGQILGKAAVLLIIVLNLPYLAFITVPRYNLMAIPAIIILAAAAIGALVTLLKNNKLARAPKLVCLAAVFLFVYLRDDLRAPFSFGAADSLSLYIVQGTDLLTRSLITTFGTLTLLASLWFCIPLLTTGAMKVTTGRVFVVLLVAALLPLSLFPQRANGRFQEGLITFSTPGDMLTGQIPVERATAISGPSMSWFLLVDSDLGQLPNQQFEIELNGKKITTPAMPSLAALDDWHYLKRNSTVGNYLECSYIFDCLSREAARRNTDLRQWFVIPLSAEQQTAIEKNKSAEIAIIQKSSQPTTLFTTARLSNNKQFIPSRKVYSWEKAFYGVENDQGLTCPRYDEAVPKRSVTWTIKAQGKSEELSGIDLNVRLIAVQNIATENNTTPLKNIAKIEKASGFGNATLNLNKSSLSEGQLAGISVKLAYAPDYRPEAHIVNDLLETKPQLTLHWLDQAGAKQTMDLPWLSKPHEKFALLLPLDLRQIDGSQFSVVCAYPDNNCQIELTSCVLNCHPLRSRQELF